MGGACTKKVVKDEKPVSHSDVVAITIDVTPAPQVERPRRESTTRNRRLSVVNAEENAEDDEATPNDDPPVIQKSVTENKRNTRNRRLSVVTPEEVEKEMHVQFTAPDPEPKEHKEPVQIHHMSRSTSSKSRVLFGSEIGCLSRTGREPGFKKTNQDNCFAFEKFIRHGHSLYAAFDGHGPHGHEVSLFAKHHLPLGLTRKLGRRTLRDSDEEEIKNALRQVFCEVHESVCLPPIDAEFSGTTATVGLVLGSKLYTAWVGDSRCVLGVMNERGGIVAKDVTLDHKPDNESERERIVASGGRVKRLTDDTGAEIGPSRVWLKYAWIPGLAMSRALGDICAHQVGVSCDPDVSVTDITPEVAFLVMASDGVWEFVTSQEAVDIIQSSADAPTACRKLIDEAYHRWLMEENGVVDDITAVVVKFDHFPQRKSTDLSEAE